MYKELFDSDPFVIADLHMGHRRIEVYCNRPRDWENLIIDNWNREVKKEDKVLFLGDFALAGKDDTTFYKSLLNGEVYFIKGNHDWHSRNFYRSIGFIVVEDKILTYNNWVFSHRPIQKMQEDLIYFHGHSHNNFGSEGNRYNVSVEQLNYTPIRISKLLGN